MTFTSGNKYRDKGLTNGGAVSVNESRCCRLTPPMLTKTKGDSSRYYSDTVRYLCYWWPPLDHLVSGIGVLWFPFCKVRSVWVFHIGCFISCRVLTYYLFMFRLKMLNCFVKCFLVWIIFETTFINIALYWCSMDFVFWSFSGVAICWWIYVFVTMYMI